MGELIVGLAVVLDRLTVHEPQLDVGKAAAPERFVGFLDRQRYEIGGVTDEYFVALLLKSTMTSIVMSLASSA